MENVQDSLSATETPTASSSLLRSHLASYPILAKPYNLVNSYTPFHLPSKIIDSLPGLPLSLDHAVDQYLTQFDNAIDNSVKRPIWRGYESVVVKPKEVVKTGMSAYIGKGMEIVADSVRVVEKKVSVVGEYLLPEEGGSTTTAPPSQESTAIEETITSSNATTSTVQDDVSYRDALVATSLDPDPVNSITAGGAGANWPTSAMTETNGQASTSRPSSSHSQTAAADEARQELERLTSILQIYATRAYERNAHKSTPQLVHDAFGLTRAEFLKAKDMVDQQWAIEKAYLLKMMTARQEDKPKRDET